MTHDDQFRRLLDLDRAAKYAEIQQCLLHAAGLLVPFFGRAVDGPEQERLGKHIMKLEEIRDDIRDLLVTQGAPHGPR